MRLGVLGNGVEIRTLAHSAAQGCREAAVIPVVGVLGGGSLQQLSRWKVTEEEEEKGR